MSESPGGRPTLSRRTGREGSVGLRLGRVAGVPLLVSPTWFLVAGLITVSFAPTVEARIPGLGSLRYAVTAAFALLLYGSVVLHELSHALVARRLGLQVRAITLHFLGGFTQLEPHRPSPRRDFLVAFAGPVVSLAVGGLALLAAQPIDAAVPEYLLGALAVSNLVVGAFNLLPALPLDGGHMLRAAVWKVSGDDFAGSVVASVAGVLLAALLVVSPWLASPWLGPPDVFQALIAVLVASFLWTGARQSLKVAQLRRRLPRLVVRSLARRAIPVAASLPLAEAVRRAHAAGARALVVVDGDGKPTGLVNEQAVADIPEQQRPWVDVASVSRGIASGLVLRADLEGEPLVLAMQESPATEYLVVEPTGEIYGVLVTADVDAALATA